MFLLSLLDLGMKGEGWQIAKIDGIAKTVKIAGLKERNVWKGLPCRKTVGG